MSELIQRIRAAQIRAAEDAVIAGIPAELLAMLDNAQAEHEKKGGCPGCGSMVHAVHKIPCPAAEDDLY